MSLTQKRGDVDVKVAAAILVAVLLSTACAWRLTPVSVTCMQAGTCVLEANQDQVNKTRNRQTLEANQDQANKTRNRTGNMGAENESNVPGTTGLLQQSLENATDKDVGLSDLHMSEEQIVAELELTRMRAATLEALLAKAKGMATEGQSQESQVEAQQSPLPGPLQSIENLLPSKAKSWIRKMQANGKCKDASSIISCDPGYVLKTADDAYCAGAICQDSDKSECCEVFHYFRLSDTPSIGVGRKAALSEIKNHKCGCGGTNQIKCLDPQENAAPVTMVKIELDVEIFWFFHIKVGGNVMTRDWTEEKQSYRSFSLNAALSFKLPIGGLELSASGTILFRTKNGMKMSNLFWYGLRSLSMALMEKFTGDLSDDADEHAEAKKEEMKEKYIKDMDVKFKSLKVPLPTAPKQAYANFMEEKRVQLEKKSKGLVSEVKALVSDANWNALTESVKKVEKVLPPREADKSLVHLVNKCDAYARFVHSPGVLAELENYQYRHNGSHITQLDIFHSATYIVTGMAIKVANLVYKHFFTGVNDNGLSLGDLSHCSFDPNNKEGHVTCLLMRFAFSEVTKDDLKKADKGYILNWPLPKGLTAINARQEAFHKMAGTHLSRDLYEAGFIRIPLEAFAPVEKLFSDLAYHLRNLFAQIRIHTKLMERIVHRESGESVGPTYDKLVQKEWSKLDRIVEPIDRTIGYVREKIREFTKGDVLRGALATSREWNLLVPNFISENVAQTMLDSDLLTFKLMLQELGIENYAKLGCRDEAMKYFVSFSCVLQVSAGHNKSTSSVGAAYGWLLQVQAETKIEKLETDRLVFQKPEIVSKKMRMLQMSITLPFEKTLGFVMKQSGKNFVNDYNVLGKFKLEKNESKGVATLAVLIPQVVNEAVKKLQSLPEHKDDKFNKDLEELDASAKDTLQPEVDFKQPDSLIPNTTIQKCAFLGGLAAQLSALKGANLLSSKATLVFNVLYTRFPSGSTAFDVSLSLESATQIQAGTGDWSWILPANLPKFTIQAALINTYDLSAMRLDTECRPSEGAVIHKATGQASNMVDDADGSDDASGVETDDDDGGDPDDR